MHAVAGPDALWLRASAPHEEVDGEILSRSHSPKERASLSYSPGRLLTVSVLWLSTACRRWTTRNTSGSIGPATSDTMVASKMPCTALS